MKYVCCEAIEDVFKDFVSGCGVAADDKEIEEEWKCFLGMLEEWRRE